MLCTQFESPEERQRACNNWAVSAEVAGGGWRLPQAAGWARGSQGRLPLPRPPPCVQAELMPQLCGRGKPDLCFVFVSARRCGGAWGAAGAGVPCRVAICRHPALGWPAAEHAGPPLPPPAAATTTCPPCWRRCELTWRAAPCWRAWWRLACSDEAHVRWWGCGGSGASLRLAAPRCRLPCTPRARSPPGAARLAQHAWRSTPGRVQSAHARPSRELHPPAALPQTAARRVRLTTWSGWGWWCRWCTSRLAPPCMLPSSKTDWCRSGGTWAGGRPKATYQRAARSIRARASCSATATRTSMACLQRCAAASRGGAQPLCPSAPLPAACCPAAAGASGSAPAADPPLLPCAPAAATAVQLARRYPADTVVGGMGGGTDGGPSLLVGLPGRGKGEPLHASVTSGTVLLGISGPGVETIPLTARGMRCISQARLAGASRAEGRAGLGGRALLRCHLLCSLLAWPACSPGRCPPALP